MSGIMNMLKPVSYTVESYKSNDCSGSIYEYLKYKRMVINHPSGISENVICYTEKAYQDAIKMYADNYPDYSRIKIIRNTSNNSQKKE